MKNLSTLANFVLLTSLLGGIVHNPAARAYDYIVDPQALLELDSYQASASPAHYLSVMVQVDELETYQVSVNYAQGFDFNGFDRLGPAGTPVGFYSLDLDFDGEADIRVDLLSLNADTAYADMHADGSYNWGLEPILEFLDRNEARLRMPYGGDGASQTLTAPWSAKITLGLAAGLLTNPQQGGRYAVEAELTSIDPDTDGPDDFANSTPLQASLRLEVEIEDAGGSGEIPFWRLDVGKARLWLHHPRHAIEMKDFWIRGRYELGAASDGIDLENEDIEIRVAGFVQQIPAGALRKRHSLYWFHSRKPGVKRLLLFNDGRFLLHLRHPLDTLDPAQPVVFALRLGDDSGESLFLLEPRGRFHYCYGC